MRPRVPSFLFLLARRAPLLAALAFPILAAKGERPASTATPTPQAAPALAPEDRRSSPSAQQPPSPTQTPAFTEPSGGSLGDVVKKSREERETKGKKKARSLGVITNENLKKPGSGGSEGTSKAKGGSLTILPPGSMPVPGGPKVAPEIRDLKGRTEEDWRQILAKNRSDQEKAEADVKRLEVEVKRLENDFYAWSDGNYRERVIRPSWDQAREDLKKARAELDAAAAARSDLEEDARKSGTPPGWLRDR